MKDLGEATELEQGHAVQLSDGTSSINASIPSEVLHTLVRVVGPEIFGEGSCEWLGRLEGGQDFEDVPSSPDRRADPSSPAMVHGDRKRKRGDDEDVDIADTLIANEPEPTTPIEDQEPPRKKSFFSRLFGR